MGRMACAEIWEHESPASWLHIPLEDGSTGGAVQMHRAHAPKPSVYLSAWFNSLRTAYGMALYARRSNNIALMELAKETLNLALKAPGAKGACLSVSLFRMMTREKPFGARAMAP